MMSKVLKYSVANYGEMLLGFLHEAYPDSEYVKDLSEKRINDEGFYKILAIDNNLRIDYREWIGKPYFINVVRNANQRLIQLDLTNLVVEAGKFTWCLSAPKNKQTRALYDEFFKGNFPEVPKNIRDSIKAQRLAVDSPENQQLLVNGYLLTDAQDIDTFKTTFINFIDKVISPYTRKRPALVKYYEIDSNEAFEGYKSERRILAYKRNREIVLARKIKDDFTCQACGFRIELNGKYIIECHHLNPIASGTRITSMDAIISLCPTCHRMVHTKTPAYSPGELKKLLNKKN